MIICSSHVKSIEVDIAEKCSNFNITELFEIIKKGENLKTILIYLPYFHKGAQKTLDYIN